MNNKQKPRYIPFWVALVTGVFAVSTASIFIRYAQEDAPSLVIASSRLLIAAALIFPFAWHQKKEMLAMDRKSFLLMGLSGVILAAHFATWITSLEFTSVASSVVIVTTASLWVALFSPFLLKEKISGWTFFGIGVSSIGGIIVSVSNACIFKSGGLLCSDLNFLFQGNSIIGNILALAGAFCSAGYMMIGRRMRSSQSLLTYTFVVYSTAALVLFILTLLRGYSFVGYSTVTYVWLFLLAIIPQLVGHSAFNYSLRYAKASMVSIALLGEPIGTVLLAMFFLRENPTPLEIIGGSLILVGIFIVSRFENDIGKIVKSDLTR